MFGKDVGKEVGIAARLHDRLFHRLVGKHFRRRIGHRAARRIKQRPAIAQRIKRRTEQIAAQPRRQLHPGAPPQASQREQAAHCVEHQNVARPKEVMVGQAEQRQPAQPPGLQPAGLAACPGLFHEQHHPRPEQQGEQTAQFAIDQHELHQPQRLVRRVRRSEEPARPHIGRERLAITDHIGRQNPQHGHPADQIEAGDTVCLR